MIAERTLDVTVTQLNATPTLPSLEATVLAALAELRAEVRALKAKVSAPMAATLTVEQTAFRLGCGRRKVFELLREGKLRRATRRGRATVVTVASIEALEQEGVPVPAPQLKKRSTARPAAFNAEAELAKLDTLLEARGPQFAHTRGRVKSRVRVLPAVQPADNTGKSA